jgi:hypothetical protein
MEVVKTLPRGIKLSQYLQERASCYIVVMYFAYHFYLPATKEVRNMLSIDKTGKPTEEKKQSKFSKDFNNDKALQDIVGALHLQFRDDILSGIKENLADELLDEMRKFIRKPIHRRVMEVAHEVEGKKLLKEHNT